ncbi:MAG: pilus assembly protein TadG-related protein [Candidatus Dormibacteraeota bacterium]|nr:pilus assembly protein TadG-related protein [Candidatus Dormibacteraeota bacterium]
MRARRGQSILYAILLMPTLLLVFSLTVDMGQLQMQRVRLRYAVETATLSGASSVDMTHYTQTGRLRLDRTTALETTHTYLDRNLGRALGVSEATIAAQGADIRVINEIPGVNPFTGKRLNRPSVCARIDVPYRLSLIGFVGRVGTGRLNVTTCAEIRP